MARSNTQAPAEVEAEVVEAETATLSALEKAEATLRDQGFGDLADQMLAELETVKAAARKRTARVLKEFKERFAASCDRSNEDLKPGYQALEPLVADVNAVLSDRHGSPIDLSLPEISSIIQIYTGPEGRAARAELKEAAGNGASTAIVDPDDDDNE